MKTPFGFLLGLTLVLSFSLVTADALALGPSEDYVRIQAAIDAANPGDTVKLQALFGVWQVDS